MGLRSYVLYCERLRPLQAWCRAFCQPVCALILCAIEWDYLKAIVMLSSIKNNTKMLKKLYSKLLFVAKLTSATLTQTNGETIVSRTPKAVTLGALKDLRPVSASLRGSAVLLFRLGLAAKSKMPIRHTEMLTAEQTANVLPKPEASPPMIVSPRSRYDLTSISDAKMTNTTAKIAVSASFRTLPCRRGPTKAPTKTASSTIAA